MEAKPREKSKFDRKVKIVELVIKAIALFLSASVFVAVCVNTQIGNITNNYREELSLEKKLVDAQNYYLDGYYIKAYEAYEEMHNESAVASLNLGYLYSKGLGCKSDFSLACRYYKQAHKKGLEEGLINYIAINLITPNSFEETISALLYGYENDNHVAIHYLSYFETGKMYGELYDCCRENAKNFIARDIYDQIEKIKDKLSLENAEMIRIEDENIPKNTDFKTYTKYDDLLELVGNKSIQIPIEENGRILRELKHVNAYKTSPYYIISYYRFDFADYFAEESYYKI